MLKLALIPRTTIFDRTPLSYVAEHGTEKMVLLLLGTKQVNPNIKDKKARTPLSYAMDNKHHLVRKLLLLNNPRPGSKTTSHYRLLCLAAENGDKSLVKLLLATCDIEINSQNFNGRTPLFRAAEQGHGAIVRLLIPRDNITLHMQVQEGKQAPVKSLLQAGYDVNIMDSLNRTPLHIAALSSAQTEIAKHLIKHGAEINVEDCHGATPLRIELGFRIRHSLRCWPRNLHT
jgi:ankyrin repeat protein